MTKRTGLVAAALATLALACDRSEEGGESGEAAHAELAETARYEAERNLRTLTDRIMDFCDNQDGDWQSEYGDSKSMPTSVARTPAEVPCGEAVEVPEGTWAEWTQLGFSPQNPTRFSYELETAGSGLASTFTASAWGDLDCDGTLSRFYVTGRAFNAVDYDQTSITMAPVARENPEE